MRRAEMKYASIIAQEALHIKAAALDDVSALATLRYQWRTGERGEEGLSFSAFTDEFRLWMEIHSASHVPFLGTEGSEPIAMGWLAIVDRVPGPSISNDVQATCRAFTWQKPSGHGVSGPH